MGVKYEKQVLHLRQYAIRRLSATTKPYNSVTGKKGDPKVTKRDPVTQDT